MSDWDLDKRKVVVFSLSHSYDLTLKVGEKLQIPTYSLKKRVFADQEIIVDIPVSVRNYDVFLCQSTSQPANEAIMELLIAIDALKRASVNSISLIIPYFGYGRQDRKAKGREPITAKLIANLISHFAVKRVLTFDLHSPQIQGFFDIPIDHLTVLPLLLTQLLQREQLSNYVLISPDRGGYSRVKKLSEHLQVPVAVMDKIRPEVNQAKLSFFLGDVTNKNAVFVDDMIDTGGTLVGCINYLQKRKVRNVYVVAAHGVFSKNALDKLFQLYQKGLLKKIFVSNSVVINNPAAYPFLSVYCLSDYIRDLMQLILTGGSISGYGKKQFDKLAATTKTVL